MGSADGTIVLALHFFAIALNFLLQILRVMAALHSFAAEAFTLLALGIVVIGFRTYARAKQEGIRKLKMDDYLMLLVIIPYTTEIVLAYTVGARFYGLANNAMTDEQRAALSPGSEEYKWRHVQS